jgi:hypothetical protein
MRKISGSISPLLAGKENKMRKIDWGDLFFWGMLAIAVVLFAVAMAAGIKADKECYQSEKNTFQAVVKEKWTEADGFIFVDSDFYFSLVDPETGDSETDYVYRNEWLRYVPGDTVDCYRMEIDGEACSSWRCDYGD